MTREEAISWLVSLTEHEGEDVPIYDNDIEALNLAISALEHPERNVVAIVPCGDTISRQAVLDLIADYDLSMGQVVRGIHDLPSVTPQEPRWIPVRERLPEAGECIRNVERYYLVQNEYGDMLVARYTHSGYWEQIYQLKPIGDEIVAWMPLPKPYEPQESEE